MATNIRQLTGEQYLALEAESEVKHEYIDGEIFAMTGATLFHNRIAMNTAVALGNQMIDSDCWLYSSDMRVKINELSRYVYPDKFAPSVVNPSTAMTMQPSCSIQP